MSISVRMFPAGCGESFLLKLGKANILIDGGFNETYESYIRNELFRLAEKQECLDLVVVTHFDQDHLLGILSFIKENGNANNPRIIVINDVWYNCYSSLPLDDKNAKKISVDEKEILKSYLHNSQYTHRSSTSTEPISGVQGMGLTYSLINGRYPINKAVNYTAIDSTAPEISISNNAQIHILSPSNSQLKALSQYWYSELRKKRWTFNVTNDPLFNHAMESHLLFGYSCFENKSESVSGGSWQPDIEELLKVEAIPDNSIVNASSIALLIKSKNKQMLFLGDAHEEQLLYALEQIYSEPTDIPLFDLIKVPHHGSLKNCMKLFDKIDSRIFLFSTDGSGHGHPDLETIARIVARPTQMKRELVFNYKNKTFEYFNRQDWMDKYNYSIILNSTGDSIEI